MKYIFYLFIFTLLFINNVSAQSSSSFNQAEPLSETPLHPIPSEMTFEEYQDMNRRLSQAYIWSSIPIPGITHQYAGEKKKARMLFYIGMGGLACIVAGIVSMDETSWPKFDENIHFIQNQDTNNEKWFEKTPVAMEGNIIHYRLKEIQKEGDGGGLIILGAGILLVDFIYDRFKGLQLIEEKRDRVRFKYGQKLILSNK